MKVRLTRMAFIGGSRQRPGSIVDIGDAEPASWMEPVEEAEAPRRRAPATRAPAGQAEAEADTKE
jgi:hypothetical protein